MPIRVTLNGTRILHPGNDHKQDFPGGNATETLRSIFAAKGLAEIEPANPVSEAEISEGQFCFDKSDMSERTATALTAENGDSIYTARIIS